MSEMNIRSSKKDYDYALEGVTYAVSIVDNRNKELDSKLSELKIEGVMSGETGDDYVKKISEAVSMVNGVGEKLRSFCELVTEQCAKNGSSIDANVTAKAEDVQKRFNAIAQDVRAVTGK